MNVLFLADYPRNLGANPGGPEMVVQVLADRLVKVPDLSLSVLSCEPGLEEALEIHRGAFRCFHIPSPQPKIFTRVVRDTSRITTKILELSPDIIHSHLARYTVAALRTGIPTVWTVHAITKNQRQDYAGISGFVRGHTYEALDRWCLKRVRHIIEISPYVCQSFSPLTQARFHPIENPVDERYFQLDDHRQSGRLLTVGSIEPRKGTLDLLCAARRLKERGVAFTLHLVGRSKDDPYCESVLGFVRGNRLENEVKLVGVKFGEELLREYAEAAVCVLPSREETAPMTILEAMAAGKPVVATAVGGNPWIVQEGHTGFLVNHGDAEAMASRLESLLHSPERGLHMGHRARGEAHKRFHPDVVARKTVTVYRTMLAA